MIIFTYIFIWGRPFGIIRGHFKIILDQFRTILGPPMPNNYVFQRKITILELAHTNFVLSIRITPDQPLIWTKNNKRLIFRISKQALVLIVPKVYSIRSYIQKFTMNLMKILLWCKTHPKHPNAFSTIHFQKHISLGLPRPLRTAVELTNWFAYVNKYARRGYTNVQNTFSNFPNCCFSFFYVEGHTAQLVSLIYKEQRHVAYRHRAL